MFLTCDLKISCMLPPFLQNWLTERHLTRLWCRSLDSLTRKLEKQAMPVGLLVYESEGVRQASRMAMAQ